MNRKNESNHVLPYCAALILALATIIGLSKIETGAWQPFSDNHNDIVTPDTTEKTIVRVETYTAEKDGVTVMDMTQMWWRNLDMNKPVKADSAAADTTKHWWNFDF